MNGFLLACAVTCGVFIMAGMAAAIVRAHRTAMYCCAVATAIMATAYLVDLAVKA